MRINLVTQSLLGLKGLQVQPFLLLIHLPFHPPLPLQIRLVLLPLLNLLLMHLLFKLLLSLVLFNLPLDSVLRVHVILHSFPLLVVHSLILLPLVILNHLRLKITQVMVSLQLVREHVVHMHLHSVLHLLVVVLEKLFILVLLFDLLLSVLVHE